MPASGTRAVKTALEAKQGVPGRAGARVIDWLAQYELLFLLLLAPLFLFPGPWTVAGVAVVVIFWLIRLLATGRLTLPTPMDGALALLFLATLAGLLVSPAPTQGIPRFWTIFLGLALFYGLVNGLRTWAACRLAGDLLVAAGLGLALLTLLGTDWLSTRMMGMPIYESLPALLRDPAGGDLFNPRVMGMALAVLVPVPLSLALSGGSTWRRLVAAAVALVMIAVLVLTQAIQAVLGLVVALCVLLIWRSRWFLLLIPAGLALAAAAVLAYGPQQLAVDLLTIDHPLGVAVVLRLDIWSRAWAMIRDLPFTGIGLDAFPFVQSSFYPGFVIGPEPHAHNLYLQLALDVGLPGLLGLLWLVVAFAWLVGRSTSRLAERDARALLMGASAGVAAYLAAGLIDTPWATKPGVLLWILLGLAVALAQLAPGSPLPAKRRWQLYPLLGLAAILVLSLVLVPGLGARNLGFLVAHKALAHAQDSAQVEAGQMAQSIGLLERGLAWQPGHIQSYRTLGRLRGWLGQQEEALTALERSVDLDGREPMARYGPWLPWLRQLTHAEPVDPWDDLLWVYRYWNNRYPKRAEGYVLHAIVWAQHKDNLSEGQAQARAQALLQSGLDAGAKPTGLLTYSSSLLSPNH